MPPPQTPTPAQALLTTRILWAALLAGQLVFLAVIAVMMSQGSLKPVEPQLTMTLFAVALGAIILAIPLGYFLRGQIYKKHWRENIVEPRGYVTGNLVLLALCEGPAMLALVACLLSASFWPALLPALLAMGIQILNFPHGQPMLSSFTP